MRPTLKEIHRAASAEAAAERLDAFEQGSLGQKRPPIADRRMPAPAMAGGHPVLQLLARGAQDHLAVYQMLSLNPSVTLHPFDPPLGR